MVTQLFCETCRESFWVDLDLPLSEVRHDRCGTMVSVAPQQVASFEVEEVSVSIAEPLELEVKPRKPATKKVKARVRKAGTTKVKVKKVKAAKAKTAKVKPKKAKLPKARKSSKTKARKPVRKKKK